MREEWKKGGNEKGRTGREGREGGKGKIDRERGEKGERERGKKREARGTTSIKCTGISALNLPGGSRFDRSLGPLLPSVSPPYTHCLFSSLPSLSPYSRSPLPPLPTSPLFPPSPRSPPIHLPRGVGRKAENFFPLAIPWNRLPPFPSRRVTCIGGLNVSAPRPRDIKARGRAARGRGGWRRAAVVGVEGRGVKGEWERGRRGGRREARCLGRVCVCVCLL